LTIKTAINRYLKNSSMLPGMKTNIAGVLATIRTQFGVPGVRHCPQRPGLCDRLLDNGEC
jgi:hypothetical protein